MDCARHELKVVSSANTNKMSTRVDVDLFDVLFTKVFCVNILFNLLTEGKLVVVIVIWVRIAAGCAVGQANGVEKVRTSFLHSLGFL